MVVYFKDLHYRYVVDDIDLSVEFFSVVTDERSLVYMTKPDFESFLSFAYKCFEVVEPFV